MVADAVCAGDTARLEALGPGSLLVEPLSDSLQPKPEWGAWRTRSQACGLDIKAYDCVAEPAVCIACRLLERMLEGSPPEVVERLVRAGACVGIIGRCQLTTDMPGHTYMKLNNNGGCSPISG
jgi:hypothetical protein